MRGLRSRLVIAMLGVGALVGGTGGAVSHIPGAQARAAAGPPERVIVRAGGGNLEAAGRAVHAVGGRITADLSLIGSLGAEVPAGALARLGSAPGVAAVYPDARLQLLSDPTPGYDPTTDIGSAYTTSRITGAQTLWSHGGTGAGVDVALIDSGVVPVDGLTAPGHVVNGPDLSFEALSPYAHLDTFGHGTMMGSLIAGRDDAATPGHYVGDRANYLGMAPDARLVSIKVADSRGQTDVTQVVAALAWVVTHRSDAGFNIRVVNLSFGTDGVQAYQLDPLADAVEQAWRAGVVVVVSAGNNGWKSTGLLDPAYDPWVLAVGAADTAGTATVADDRVATFSNRGDGVRNPDIVTPGVHTVGLRDPGSYIDSHYGQTATVGGRLFRGSGTSEAAAITSGAVADLLSLRPLLTPDQVKALLIGTARPLNGVDATLQGNGELNLAGAAAAATPAGPGQGWDSSSGSGSLDGARGSARVSVNGVTVSGEVDVASLVQGGTGVVDGIGSHRLFDQHLSDPGTWGSATWTSADPSSATWTSATWTSATWTSSAWNSATWTSATWTSSGWSSATWTSATWTSATWTSDAWSSATWTGSSWDSVTWGR